MLTKQDRMQLREDFKEVFATKADLLDLKKGLVTKEEYRTDNSDVLQAVKGISLIVHNHEYWITTLEESKMHN